MKNNSVFIVRVAAEEISEEAWKKLEEIGCQVLYSSEEDGLLQFFCHFPEGVTEKSVIANYPAVLSIVDSGPLQIDWESQWAQHAPGYRDGYLYVDLGSQAKPRELKLKPGPGWRPFPSHHPSHVKAYVRSCREQCSGCWMWQRHLVSCSARYGRGFCTRH